MTLGHESRALGLGVAASLSLLVALAPAATARNRLPRAPRLAPLLASVARYADAGNSFDVVRVDPRRRTRVQLPIGSPGFLAGEAAPIPGKDQIVFLRAVNEVEYTGPFSLAVAGRDGRGARRLTPADPYHGDQDPAPAPNGRAIAFSRIVQLSPTSANFFLHIQPLGGGPARQVTSRVTALQAAWGPRLIAFVNTRGGTNPFGTPYLSSNPAQVWVVGADGRGARQVTFHGTNWSPAWGPRGRWLVAARRAGKRSGLVRVDPRTRRSRWLTRAPAGQEDVTPDVSPNGRWIAFARGRPTAHHLVVMSAGGGPVMPIPGGTGRGMDIYHPAWL